jgi:hypothetical protein
MQRLQYPQIEAVSSSVTFINKRELPLKRKYLGQSQFAICSSGNCALAWQIQRSNWICLDFPACRQAGLLLFLSRKKVNNEFLFQEKRWNTSFQ